MNNKKKNISVRLSCSDIQTIKDISTRLGVRESDLFRFSIKNLLSKLSPLNDYDRAGADLIPVWLDFGDQLIDQFDLDEKQLNKIFNSGVDDVSKCVDLEDLTLIAMSKKNPLYLVKRLSQECDSDVNPSNAPSILRTYLYEKYVLGKKHSFLSKGVAYNFMGDTHFSEFSVN